MVNDIKSFIESATLKHGGFYDYSKSVYKGSKNKIEIKCPEHGWVWLVAGNHIRGSRCPKCAKHISRPETEVREYIEKLGYVINKTNRKIISPYELDIYIPSLNKAIEFNGTYYHYSKKRFREGYHAMKSNLCKEKGIKLLHIREDLWLKDRENYKKIIQEFLKYVRNR